MSQHISRPQLAWFFVCGLLLWCAVALSLVLLVEWFGSYAYAADEDDADVAALQPPARLNQQERRTPFVGEQDPLNLHLAYNFRAKKGMEHTVQAAWFSSRLVALEFLADFQEDKFNDNNRHNAGPMLGLNYVFGNKIRTLLFALGGLTSGESLTWQAHVGSRTFTPRAGIIGSTDIIVRGDEFLDARAEFSIELDTRFVSFKGCYWDMGYQFLHLPAQDMPRFTLGLSFFLFPWLFEDPLRLRFNTIVGNGAAGLWTGVEYTF